MNNFNERKLNLTSNTTLDLKFNEDRISFDGCEHLKYFHLKVSAIIAAMINEDELIFLIDLWYWLNCRSMCVKIYLYGLEVWPLHQVLGLTWNAHEWIWIPWLLRCRGLKEFLLVLMCIVSSIIRSDCLIQSLVYHNNWNYRKVYTY